MQCASPRIRLPDQDSGPGVVFRKIFDHNATANPTVHFRDEEPMFIQSAVTMLGSFHLPPLD